MNELDCVKLTENYMGLKCGTQGTVVLKYDDHHFEVEFFNQSGETIGVYTITSEYLCKIHK